MNTIDQLTNEYDSFLSKHELPRASADELLHMLQTVAVPFLTDFVRRWEAAEQAASQGKADMRSTMGALGGYVEHMGGGCRAWWINLGEAVGDEPAPAYALITDVDGSSIDGDPDAPEWMVGRYLTVEHGDAAELHDGKTFAEAVAIVTAWREAAK